MVLRPNERVNLGDHRQCRAGAMLRLFHACEDMEFARCVDEGPGNDFV